MAEFAIILPVFMLLVVGLLVFGRMFFYWIEANHVANETARWAAVDRNPYNPQSLQLHARESATQEFANSARVCINFPDGATPQVGQRVRVDVEVPVSFAGFFDLGLTLRGSSTMRIERFADGESPTSYSAACTS